MAKDKDPASMSEVEEIASEVVGKAEAEIVNVETSIEEKAKALEIWFDKHIRDSVVSRATDSYNRVAAAFETIRDELARHKA